MTHPFTPKYIEMAKAAEEIQDGDHEQEGNYFYCPLTGDVWVYPNYPNGEDIHSCDPFLPRLDQLLGMLELPAPLHIVGLLSYEISVRRNQYWEGFQDWHELALSVVMREKHGKRWNGKEWVKG